MIGLTSSNISLTLRPELGGTITSVISSRTRDEWIYFDQKRVQSMGHPEVYDDVWAGGFEELFPNDAPGVVEGRSLKDHGELWQQQWSVVYHDGLNVKMHLQCSTVPVKVSKDVSMLQRHAGFSIHYTLRNTSDTSFPYLFKLHPAMRIESGDEILLPGGTVIPVDLGFSKTIGSKGPFQWPRVEGKNKQTDLSIIPDRSEREQEFIYVKDLPEGWCGLKRKRTGEKFIIRYLLSDFPYCWFFMAFGGWRDHYTLVMEPCTNFPKDMKTAIANRTSAVMEPNEVRTFSVSVSIEQ